MLGDYHEFDGVALARLTAKGEISPAEILESTIQSISNLNPEINALVEVYHDFACAQIDAGLPLGPLHGVPLVLKDLGCPAAGTRTTFGSELFSTSKAWDYDGQIVRKLKQAGAIIVGRSNTCEFGLSLVTEPLFYGPTQNPHKRGYTPGGSSGGSAAAVAAGLVPIAHATDGCGSIRVPASNCGLFGMKTTRARISLWPDAGDGWAGMSTFGCLSRTVRDTATFLDVVGGAHLGDPYSAAAPARSYVCEALSSCPSLRVGVIEHSGGPSIDQECEDALSAARMLLDGLGHRIELVSVETNLEETAFHLIPIWAAQLWGLIEPRYMQLGMSPNGWGMEPQSWELALKAKELTADDYARSVRYIHRKGREYAELMKNVDVLISPVTARAPWLIGELDTSSSGLGRAINRLFNYCPFTVDFNMTGQPAMSVPIHWTSDGRPIGIQVAGHYGAESLLFRLAAQLESSAPWQAHAFSSANHRKNRTPDKHGS